jgi:hypothetical protein
VRRLICRVARPSDDVIIVLYSQLELDTLNLSKNCIRRIENLSHLQKLSTLILSYNCVHDAQDIQHLLQVPSVQTVDIQHNKIDDPAVIDVLSQLPDLRVLYLQGNEVVKKIPHYRKTVLSRCKALKYLDDRPVFDDERRRVTAWATALETTGSIEVAQQAERDEINAIRVEKDQADERNFKAFEEMMRNARKSAEKAGTADPDDQNEEINVFSGERIVNVPESASLKEIREQRWASDNANAGSAVTVQSDDTKKIWESDAIVSDDVQVVDPVADDIADAEDIDIELVAEPNSSVEITGSAVSDLDELD